MTRWLLALSIGALAGSACALFGSADHTAQDISTGAQLAEAEKNCVAANVTRAGAIDCMNAARASYAKATGVLMTPFDGGTE